MESMDSTSKSGEPPDPAGLSMRRSMTQPLSFRLSLQIREDDVKAHTKLRGSAILLTILASCAPWAYAQVAEGVSAQANTADLSEGHTRRSVPQSVDVDGVT